MATKSPDPVFEVVFQRIYPEAIPLGTLSRVLSAIQRLASGTTGPDDEDENEEADPFALASNNQIQLLGVKRGSAVYKFAGMAAPQVVRRLSLLGKVLADPFQIGEDDYLLSPLERISASVKTLGCKITIRTPGRAGDVLAEIGPASYDEIAKSIFVTGETTIRGNVQRVGGATDTRCALRVPFQQRLLFCKVKTKEVARMLGDSLYKDVTATGQARWIRASWHINAFTVTGVSQLKEEGSVLDAFQRLYEAGGSGWDEIDDPKSFIEEVSGK